MKGWTDSSLDPRWAGLWQQGWLTRASFLRFAQRGMDARASLRDALAKDSDLPLRWREAGLDGVLRAADEGLRVGARLASAMPQTLRIAPCDRVPWESASAFVVSVGAPVPASGALAVVGTRHLLAEESTRIEAWFHNNFMGLHAIISGGAFGVDALAHRAAIAKSVPTWAVLAGGLDHPSPRAHASLFDQIVSAGGGWVSERPLGYRARDFDFIERNRAIAAASDALLVARAPHRSGALSTARAAMKMGRRVGVLPGEWDAVSAQGTLQLLNAGARCVLGADDLLALSSTLRGALTLDLALDAGPPRTEPLCAPLPEETAALWSQFLTWDAREEAWIDGNRARHQEILLDLELAGLIRVLPGGECTLTVLGEAHRSSGTNGVKNAWSDGDSPRG